jgi:peptide deformylase
MAIRRIHIKGSPVLHTRAIEVTEFNRDLSTLVRDMYQTMDKAPGVGLAAPQIGVGLRIFVYDYEDALGNPVRGEVINPTLEVGEISNEPADEENEVEGCLSFPGERFPLKRAEWVRLSGVDLNQEPVEIEATGWLARIFQHEYDHLEGTLYVDKLTEEYAAEAAEMVVEYGWGVDGLSWLPGKDKLEG